MNDASEKSLREKLIAVLASPEQDWRMSNHQVLNRPIYNATLEAFAFLLAPSMEEGNATLAVYEGDIRVREWSGAEVHSLYRSIDKRMSGIEVEKELQKEDSLARLRRLI